MVSVVCVGLFAIFALLSFIHRARLMARKANADFNTRSLALLIEVFKEENGRYPKSLTQLASITNAEVKGSLNRILHDPWKNAYGFRLLTNGFVILVTEPDSWLCRGKSEERIYKPGDGLK